MYNTIKLFIKFLIQIIKRKFIFSSDTPVMAGLDAIVKYDGKTIAYATGVDFDEDFELQGIRTLGFHGDRDFKSLGYTLNFNVNSFVLSGERVEGSLPLPTRVTILTKKLTDFEIIDLATEETLFIIQGCKCGGASTNFDATALATKTSRWRGRQIKPMKVS